MLGRWRSGCVCGAGFAPRSLTWVGCCGLRFVVPGFAGEGDGLRPQPSPPPESIYSPVVLHILQCAQRRDLAETEVDYTVAELKEAFALAPVQRRGGSRPPWLILTLCEAFF